MESWRTLRILHLSWLQKDLYRPFFMDGVHLPQGHWGSLLFITKFSEIPGTHFIDLRRMKGWVDLGFKRKTPGLWIQCLNHWAIVYSNPVCHQHVYPVVAHSFVFSKNLCYWELLELVLSFSKKPPLLDGFHQSKVK